MPTSAVLLVLATRFYSTGLAIPTRKSPASLGPRTDIMFEIRGLEFHVLATRMYSQSLAFLKHNHTNHFLLAGPVPGDRHIDDFNPFAFRQDRHLGEWEYQQPAGTGHCGDPVVLVVKDTLRRQDTHIPGPKYRFA